MAVQDIYLGFLDVFTDFYDRACGVYVRDLELVEGYLLRLHTLYDIALFIAVTNLVDFDFLHRDVLVEVEVAVEGVVIEFTVEVVEFPEDLE